MPKSPAVLVVDDEPDNFDVIEALLSVPPTAQRSVLAGEHSPVEEPQPYVLQYASSGQAALAGLDTFAPDIILLDVMMPGMDGVEVCRRIKSMAKWQPVPIMMVTALTAKDDLARCLAAGADDFLSKPVNGLELRARVQSLLRIKHQYDDLQTLLRSREDMVKMIIHDLRNPLSNILIGLELFKRGQQFEERQEEKLSRIMLSARSLQAQIDDLLNVALIESGKLNLNRASTGLCELVQTSIANCETAALRKNLSLVTHLPPTCDRKISVDVGMMNRTLDNLLTNAIKFSPVNEKIVVQVECTEANQFKIQVADSGPGVPEAFREKIFEKYEVGTVMADVSQIGLGLAFCKMVVEAHGGSIGVSPNQPRGAVFEITLAA